MGFSDGTKESSVPITEASIIDENPENEEKEKLIQKDDKIAKENYPTGFAHTIIAPILSSHESGHLPLIIILIVSIYNFIFFSSTSGYEIYVLIPPLLGLISYFTKYWVTEKWKKTGIICVVTALLWDGIVSITFFPSGSGRGYSLESLPTLILDVIGLISIVMWLKGYKVKYIND